MGKGKKISGVIAKLRENSPYFVLKESRIKRDECAFVGKNASYITIQQLTGCVTFWGKEYVRLKWSNKKHEEWVKKVHTCKKGHRLNGNAKSLKF